MDPCSFVRISIGNLAVRFPEALTHDCYCKIKFKNLPSQIVKIPVLFPIESEIESESRFSGNVSAIAACFSLSKAQIEKSLKNPKLSILSVEVYFRGNDCGAFCGFKREKLLGRFEVSLDLKMAEIKACLAHNGWVCLGTKKKKKFGSDPELHLTIRVEPDPRFVFEFDGEPECSPQVYQVQGNTKQAVFSCKFGFRNSADRNLSPSLTMMSEVISKKKEQSSSKERKGWSITIHDLSGSPVAMASMVTPFVPSPGSNRVTRSSPGAWLILRANGYHTWKPWGRLEAWRDNTSSDTLSYRFELFHDGISAEISSSSSINTKFGGNFVIDVTTTATTKASPSMASIKFEQTLTTTTTNLTPLISPEGSCDLSSITTSRTGSGSGFDFGYLQPQAPSQNRGGFVMSTTVEGVEKQSKPRVEIGVTHVTCTEDAAAHVALAAAIDLSIDACRLFTHKLRKELRDQSRLDVV